MRVANSWEERKRHSAMYDWGVILLVYVYLLAPCRGLEDAVDCSTHTIATYIPVKNFHGEAVEKYQYSGSFTKLPAYWYFSTQSWRLKKNRLTDQMREKKPETKHQAGGYQKTWRRTTTINQSEVDGGIGKRTGCWGKEYDHWGRQRAGCDGEDQLMMYFHFCVCLGSGGGEGQTVKSLNVCVLPAEGGFLCTDRQITRAITEYVVNRN